MTVYVDPIVAWGRSATWKYDESCHLTADSDEELHAFAQNLGLKREWFQPGRGNNQTLRHYDLTVNMRRKAVQLGAKEITLKEAGNRILAGGREYEDVDTVEMHLCVTCKKNASTVESPSGDMYCAECDKCNRCGGSVAKFVRHEDYQGFVCPCVVKMNALIKKEDEKRKIMQMRKREALLSGKW